MQFNSSLSMSTSADPQIRFLPLPGAGAAGAVFRNTAILGPAQFQHQIVLNNV